MNSRRFRFSGPQCPEQLHLRIVCLLQYWLAVPAFIPRLCYQAEAALPSGKVTICNLLLPVSAPNLPAEAKLGGILQGTRQF